LLTHRQTDKQTNKNWQKHYLLSGGNKYTDYCYYFATTNTTTTAAITTTAMTIHLVVDIE